MTGSLTPCAIASSDAQAEFALGLIFGFFVGLAGGGRREGHERLERDETPCPGAHSEVMAKYLISFPSAAMVVPDGEWAAVGRDAHAVIDEAKAAGVYVFGGGIDEAVPPVLVSADGTVAEGGYPWAPPLDGGFTVLELPSREAAVAWAARIAKACRCAQELRFFQFDPQS